MYYDFRRLPVVRCGHKLPEAEPFSGWVKTSDGVVYEASKAMSKFLNSKIEQVVDWAQHNRIQWQVWEDRR